MSRSLLACSLLLALAQACEEPQKEQDTGSVDRGPAGWSDCVDYPTGHVTCSEVCADEGKLCAPLGCDGYTAMRYTMPSCSNMSDGKDYECDEVFDVTTSSYTSAQCCCW